MTRRQFFKISAGAAALLVGRRNAYAFYQTPATPLWRTALRGVGPAGIPVVSPDAGLGVAGATHYTIDMGQFADQVHPTLGATTMWGYNPAGNPLQKHLGGIIVGRKGMPIQITFRNNLPSTHIIPIDTSLPGADGAPNRAAVHLHGGFVPWVSDGGPRSWFAPDGTHGPSFKNNEVLNPSAPTGSAEYYYPMQQSARTLWYHDHAMGTTRINAYAGLASVFLIRDAFEENLKNAGLPDFVENAGRELPIVVQDKIFVGPDILTMDPGWTGLTAPGSLWYPHVYDADLGRMPAGPPPPISVVPEYFGDTMLANGTVYPQVTVEARTYRFRILNACNSRFLNLQLYIDDGSPTGITLDKSCNPFNAAALNPAASNPQGFPTSNFLLLGTEGGFLPTPAFVTSNMPFNGTPAAGSLLLAPAERVDVLFDFSKHVGQKLILYTDAPAPFPTGDAANDYFPGWNVKVNPVNAATQVGYGPNTRVIMRFNVVPATGVDASLKITKATDLTAGNDPLPVPLGVTALPPGVPVRQLTLNETFDEHGRLIQFLGTNRAQANGGFGQPYMNDPTEMPQAGTTEVWQIANLTGDTHPIHFHLVNVQIVSRQAFNVSSYKGTPNLQGVPVAPGPAERGWKETVRMNPGEVTTVIMRFNLPTVPFTVPVSPTTGGHEYVWHCHILEHEEHDMMRPLVIT
jgi:spore coat protein A